ncbi:MAG: aminotransferase class V-fold PLP-dependent enzyme [Solobacterium sp.]|nr:aminotransferase class V-fold PLP-dependent enzyme [Solobacterium sp.]
MIYLDNAATTYPKPEEVYKALDYGNRNLAFNAGRGSYPSARSVTELIQETRQLLGDLLKVPGNTVSFESSATEALNIIINGIPFQSGDTVYISPFEHNAVVRPLYNLKEKIGINIELLPFDKKTWKFDEERAADLFALKNPKAVFISHISNVTGYILPFGTIFASAKRYNSITVLDCSQSLGILNPSVGNTDFVVFAGHKSLYASFGIAGFYNLTGIKLNVTKSGGTGSDSLNHKMPEDGPGRYESGSLNSVAVAGMNASLKWLENNNTLYSHEKELTDYLIDKLSNLPNVHLFLPEDVSKIVGIVSLAVNGYSSADVGSILSEEFDICVRTGFHCSPFIHELIGSKEFNGTVRLSVGAFNTKSELAKAVRALGTL